MSTEPTKPLNLSAQPTPTVPGIAAAVSAPQSAAPAPTPAVTPAPAAAPSPTVAPTTIAFDQFAKIDLRSLDVANVGRRSIP